MSPIINEENLMREYKRTKDIKLRNELVIHYLYLAEIASKHFCGKGVEYDDLFQIACLGLISAIERFDLEKNIKFSTFAMPTITGEIKKYFRDKSCLIRLPRSLYEKTSFHLPELKKFLSIQKSQIVLSIDQQLHPSSSISLAHNLSGEDDEFRKVENRELVDRCMQSLSPREQEFIHLRYFDKKSQEEIAKFFSVSQMTVSRMEKKLLQKLKKVCLS